MARVTERAASAVDMKSPEPGAGSRDCDCVCGFGRFPASAPPYTPTAEDDNTAEVKGVHRRRNSPGKTSARSRANALLALAALAVLGNVAAAQAAGDGDLRLRDGPSASQGRLEIFLDGAWGGVCDDFFHSVDATVACRQLGYAAGRSLRGRSPLPAGMTFWLDNVGCSGNELRLEACPHNGRGVHNCAAREAVSVACTGSADPVGPNRAPAFTSASVERSVAENAPPGVAVGAPVSATDADANDTLTYTLGGTDAGAFAIDAATGQVKVGANASLDHETKDTYAVTVTATDRAEATATAAVSISVTDLDESGTVPPAALSDLPSLTVSGQAVDEGDSGTRNLTFTVTLAPASEERVTAEVSTGPGFGDASALTDFSMPGGPDYREVTARTLTFEPGETEKTVDVTIFGDRTDETDFEQLVLNLSNAVNADIATNQALGLILDDDPPPTLTVQSRTLREGDAGKKAMIFTAELSAVSGQKVLVGYDIVAGTATEGEDYRVPFHPRPQVRQISGKRGQTQITFEVEILGDTLKEGDETFQVVLSNSTNVILPTTAITGTITDDDGTDPIADGNAPPTASDNTVRISDNVRSIPRHTFRAGNFKFADPDPGDVLASVKIVTLPLLGSLELDGAAVTANQVVTKAQLDAGDLRYLPAAEGRGIGYATFSFRVSDGMAESADTYTMAIDVQEVFYEELNRIVLVDAATGVDLQKLNEDVTVTGDGSYGVRAEVGKDKLIGSVVFALLGPVVHRYSDNRAPYSLFGDANGVVNGRSLRAGKYTLSVVAYAESGGTGRWLGRRVNEFTVEAVAPSAPRNPAASTAGQTQIDLTWDAPANDGGTRVTGYRIEVSDDGSAGWTDLEANHAGTAYTHTGLTAGTTKHYRISAINPAGIGPATAAMSGSSAAAPNPVMGLTASNPSQTSVDLLWTLPTQGPGVKVTALEVQQQAREVQRHGEDGLWSTVARLAADSTSHTVKGLTAGTAYSFRIRLIADTGNVDPDAVSESTLTATLPPVLGAPTNLRAAGGNGQVMLTWDAPEYDGRITGFEFRFCLLVTPSDCRGRQATANGVAGGWASTESASAHTVSHWYFRGIHRFRLANGLRYRFQVRAVVMGVAGATTAWVEGQPSAAVAATPVDPDGTRAGAVSLGAQSPDRGRQFFRGKSLDLANGDRVDYYTFTTDGRYALGLGVRGQSVELKVTLEDADGTTVGTAGPPKDPDKDQLHIEWLAQTIDAGTYYIRVEALEDGATDYYLRFGLADPPPELSVADASAEEGPGATLDFAVTLDRSWSKAVTVDYATADGTAVAGEDYTAVSGTLTFAAGETSRTVPVPVLDDAHDEGVETMALRLSNAQGAVIADGAATGSIANSDPVPQAWLARFGRTVAEQSADAVRARLAADRAPGFRGRIAGEALPDGTGAATATAAQGGTADGDPLAVPEFPERERRAFLALLAPDGDEGTLPEGGAMAARDPVSGTSFDLVRETDGGLSLGLWGRMARSGFSGRAGDLELDGDVTSAMLGTDWQRRDALFGLMLFRSRGEGGHSGPSGAGRMEADLAGLVPWAGRRADGAATLWGAAGTGRGEMTLAPEGRDPITAGLRWSMAAAGAEGAPTAVAALGGAEVRWRADALATRTGSEAVEGLAASTAETVRLRLGLEAAWARTLASGATLVPRAEIGLRRDGGDAEAGFGLEAGGGVRFEDPGRGLSVSFDGRALALHEDGDVRDWGLAVTFGWDPRPETRLGPSVVATRGWGGASTGGVAALLGAETFPGDGGGAGSLDVEMAWGTDLPAWRHGMVGSAYGRVSGSRDAEMRLGWRVAPDAGLPERATRDFWLEPGTGGEAGIGAGLRWSEERRRMRSSAGIDLAAGEGGLEAGFRLEREW